MKKEYEKFTASNLFEGMTSISALLSAREAGTNSRPIYEIYFDRAKMKSKWREYRFLAHKAQALGFALTEVDGEQIAEQAIGNTHGGILARCGDRIFPALTAPEQLCADGFYVLLDGIEDPYNFGYALRSLYAAGVTAVFLTPRNWMSAAGVVARASAGASELLPMFVAEAETAAEIARTAGCKLVCADKDNSVSMYDADLSRPLLLVIGGEKRGISRSLLNTADQIVRIDYARPFRAALSAASAATILGYEVMRQNLK
ncbi:MAG: RNA methyltransferase [Clostridia bacterium]|nr:RNA methyltransferase [Clostridia bacterium]